METWPKRWKGLHNGQGSDALFAIADQALYRAKETGRNRVVAGDVTGAFRDENEAA